MADSGADAVGLSLFAGYRRRFCNRFADPLHTSEGVGFAVEESP